MENLNNPTHLSHSKGKPIADWLKKIPMKWYVWGGIHFVILSGLIYFDEALYKNFQAFMDWARTQRVPVFYELTKSRHWEFFEQFGSAWAGILFALFIFFYDHPKRKSLWVLFSSTAMTGFGYFFFKHMIGKMRPNVTDGIPTYMAFPTAWWENKSLAFPSGHSAFAFTLAAYLAWLYPRQAMFFYTVAGVCALSRVVTFAHYFSDIYAGALLGYLVVQLSLACFQITKQDSNT